MVNDGVFFFFESNVHEHIKEGVICHENRKIRD